MATVKGGNTTGPADVAIDEVGGEDYQLVKLAFGDASTATRVEQAAPLPVALIDTAGDPIPADSDGLLVFVGNNIQGQVQAHGVGPIDSTASTNPVVIGGYASTATPSAVSDDGDAQDLWLTRNGAVNVADAGGSLTVDGTVAATQSGTWNIGTVTTVTAVTAISNALPAGTNAIGKLAANSGVDIGDVDVTSVADTGTNAGTRVTVSNASTDIIAARSGRRGVMLINNQSVAVYIDPSGGTAATATHPRLDPGASWVLPVTSKITGITSAAYTASPSDAQVHVVELY